MSASWVYFVRVTFSGVSGDRGVSDREFRGCLGVLSQEVYISSGLLSVRN